MKHTQPVLEAISIMRPYILGGSEKELEALCKYCEITNELSRVDVLKIWNGVNLEDFDVSVLKALYMFFAERHGLKDAMVYFQTRDARNDSPFEVEWKHKYIDTLPEKQQRSAASLLSRVGKKIESFLGKDITQCNRDELIAGLSNMGYSKPRTMQKDYSMLKEYIRWYSAQNGKCPAEDIMDSIVSADIKMQRGSFSKLVSGPEELKSIIYATKDRDGYNTDSVVICLTWMGIPIQDSLELRNSDVDLLERTISIGEKKIAIPDSLFDIIYDYDKNDIVSGGSGRRWYADDIGLFIKKFLPKNDSRRVGTRMTKERINVALSEFSQKYFEITGVEKQISESSLLESGALWRVRQREKNGEEVTLELLREESGKIGIQSLHDFRRLYKTYKELFQGAI